MEEPTWMLDTNILSELVRNPQGAVFWKLSAAAPESSCTSIVVAGELRFGAVRKGSAALTERIEQLLANLSVLPLDEPADRHFADIKCDLERLGTPIGSNDLLIAAHARSRDLTLVTNNIREFGRVPELRVENWLLS